MAVCVSCSTGFPDTLAACPRCHTPAPSPRADDDTRLAAPPIGGASGADETRLASSGASLAAGGRHTMASTGWLSASGAIDHGRFPPGTVLGGRYRIVGRLGRGGMGEVFRADDLKLGQPVALKFLPPDVDRDPARLTQLHTEVRMARQVSHPNVCRVYDIDEVDGMTFLSMEYVDGEDLSSLLRRVGRFSEDRGLELSRQMCAGLAAAHERGVIHRDLKPANVMIDGTGKVRITDFGLAGITGEAIRAGTPAYMAPEQLAGAEVTVRSDLYALGLVLYELFTGRRALDGKTIAELVRQREEAGITPPSQIVRDLDPAIDRAILRCLERDPNARPASALAVAAALPGGDPLAAALAAGETPSPEMVAAAGDTSALRPLPAVLAFLFVVVSLVAFAGLSDRLSVTSLVPIDKPPEVLTDRAQTISRSFGNTAVPAGTAHAFDTGADYLRYVGEHPEIATRERLRSGRPPLVLFWYRASPRPLVPTGDAARVTFGNPPHTVSGMVSVILDPDGRLQEYSAVPAQVEAPNAAAAAPNWDAVFAATDLDRAAFAEVAPAWTPRTHSDQRKAWEGPMPGWPGVKQRIEAAAYRGQIVFVELVGPWTRPARMEETPRTRTQKLLQIAATFAAVSILFGAAIVARHNLRKGRGDRRGAARVAWIVFGATMVAWVGGASHVMDPSIELNRLFGGMGHSLWAAGAIWILYVALEPYVRRFWPSTLVSWSRLIAGGWRDPQVGRDVLIGCIFGTLLSACGPLYLLALPKLGYPPPAPLVPRLADLSGIGQIVDTLGSGVFNAAFNALWVIFGLVALRLVFRRVWATAVIATLFFSLTAGSGLFNTGPPWLAIPLTILIIGMVVYVAVHFGLLATVAFFFFSFVVGDAIVTLDVSKWFFPISAGMLLLGAALAFYGFYAARGGEPLLGRRILD